MIGLNDHRVRIAVGILLLILGMFITAVATHPTVTSPYYEENGTLTIAGGEILQLPANISAIYPYEYKSEYSLKVVLWGTGEVELKNTYTGEMYSIDLSQDGIPVTVIPPAVIELSSNTSQVLRYSLIIYPSSSVTSDLWLMILATFMAIVGAVLGVSGVIVFITKRLGEVFERK